MRSCKLTSFKGQITKWVGAHDDSSSSCHCRSADITNGFSFSHNLTRPQDQSLM